MRNGRAVAARDVSAIERSVAFQRRYRKLPPDLQHQVERAIEKLSKSPDLPGLNVERVRAASESVFSCRIGLGVRIIFQRESQGGIIRLLHVDRHDDAYRKAAFYLVHPGTFGAEPGNFPAEVSPVFEQHPTMTHEAFVDALGEELGPLIARFDLPPVVARDLAGLIAQSVASDGTDGKALPTDPGWLGGEAISVIPSTDKGPCRDVLLAFCFDGDSFNERLREVAYHAGIHCRDTRLVVLVTSQWNPREWKKNHAGAFEQSPACVIVYFAGIEGRLTRVG